MIDNGQTISHPALFPILLIVFFQVNFTLLAFCCLGQYSVTIAHLLMEEEECVKTAWKKVW